MPDAVAIVLAAGTGERLGLQAPKAFVPLGGRPILARAVSAALACPSMPSSAPRISSPIHRLAKWESCSRYPDLPVTQFCCPDSRYGLTTSGRPSGVLHRTPRRPDERAAAVRPRAVHREVAPNSEWELVGGCQSSRTRHSEEVLRRSRIGRDSQTSPAGRPPFPPPS